MAIIIIIRIVNYKAADSKYDNQESKIKSEESLHCASF